MRKISVRRVLRAMPEIALGAVIALGVGMTVIALFMSLLEVVS